VLAEELDVLVLVGMDAAGVAAPDEVGQFDEDTVGVLEILGLVDGEDGGDLLVVELVAEDGFHAFDKEDVRAFGDADARAVRDDLRRLGDDVGVERDLALGVGLPHVVLQLFAVFAGDEVAAVFLHFGHELVVDGFNRDDRVFGRAGCGVVEQLAAADHLGGFGDVGVFGYDGAGVALPDAVGRGAAGVGGPHDLPAAGGDDEIGDLHEFGDGFAARIFKHLNEVFGGSDLAQAGAHHVDGLGGAFQRAGTGLEDDGVAAFEDAYGLAAARGGGVRRREDGADHAHGLGVFGDAGLFIAFDEAHALGALDVVQHAADLALVLDDLALDVAVAGFFHSHLGELGDVFVFVDFPADGEAYLVDLFLRVVVDDCLCLAGQFHLFADGLHEILRCMPSGVCCYGRWQYAVVA